ncbi:MAG: hypothetical protein H7Z77_07750 [Chitinophagaceae bacterium]|nr:hypothetical protein [Polaromonas sp.]
MICQPFLSLRNVCLLMAALVAQTYSIAGPFEIAISPSRFELSAKSSDRLGQLLTIHNVGAAATEVSIRSLDWTYSEEGAVAYLDELQSNSCRPWVTLERKIVKISARGKAQFRFQFDIPADAPRGECRLMLAIEGVEPAQQALIQSGGASLSLPVNGRIAVAIYLAVNGAEPQFSVKQIGVKTIQGKPTPAITVTNSGDAHGRLDGSLDAVDANGQALELVPENTPILPGQTRTLPFQPRTEPNQKPRDFSLPAKVKGTLDWDRGSFKIDTELK